MLTPSKKLAKDYCFEAKELKRAGKFREAISLLLEADSKLPEDRYIINSLGDAYLKSGDFESARKILENLLYSDPHRATSILLAKTYTEQGSFQKAKDLLFSLHTLNRYDTEVLSLLYEFYKREGNDFRAEEYKRQTQRAGGKILYSLNKVKFAVIRGLIKKKQYNEALGGLRAIMEKEPDNIRALEMMSEIYTAKNRPEKVKKIYKKIHELDPDNADVQKALGISYMCFIKMAKSLLGKESERKNLIGTLEAGLKLHGNKVEYLKFYAVALGDIGRNNEAIDMAKRALKIDPDNVNVLDLLTSLHKKNGDSESAKKLYARILEIQPGHNPARRALKLGKVKKDPVEQMNSSTQVIKEVEKLLKRKKIDDAIHELEKSIESTGGSSPTQLKMLGQLYLSENKNELAKQCFDKLASDFEDGNRGDMVRFNVSTVLKRCKELRKNRKYFNAIILLKEANRRYPRNIEYLEKLTLTYTKVLDMDAANECYQKILNIDPEHKPALRALKEISDQQHSLNDSKASIKGLDFQQAKHQLQELAKEKPNNEILLYLLAKLYILSHNPAQAKLILINLIKKEKPRFQVICLLAVCTAEDDPVWTELESKSGERQVLQAYEVARNLKRFLSKEKEFIHSSDVWRKVVTSAPLNKLAGTVLSGSWDE